MDKNNAVDEFLGDLQNNDGDKTFEASPENPFEKENIEVPEIKEDEGEEEADKPLPFHKDPKVLKFVEKEVERKLKDFKPQVEEKIVKTESEVDVWERIIGNDTPEKVSALRELRQTLKTDKEDAVRLAREAIEAERLAAIEDEQEAEAELERGFEDIESTFNVDLTSNTPIARKTRNEFIEFVKRVAPKDENGEVSEYPDFEETFKLYKETKRTEPNYRARDAASRGLNRSGEASANQNRGYSWNDADKAIEGMFRK